MKKHVTSLALSKRLKELGAKQESKFYWVESQINHKWVIERKEMVKLEIFGESATSAYLASELGELLPPRLLDSDVIGYVPNELRVEKRDAGWYVYYKNISELDHNGEIWDDSDIEHGDLDTCHNIAEAMGKMYAYLLENKLI